MKRTLVILAPILILAGCSTTPGPVIDAGRMQTDALITLKANSMQTIDDFTAELKDETVKRYNTELTAAETRMKENFGNTGMVDLDQYKQLVSLYAFEVARDEAYYNTKAAEYKLKTGAQFETAARLHDAIQRYNEETGIPPETFDQLLVSSSGLLEDVLVEYQKQRELDNAKPDDYVDWRIVLNKFNQKLFGGASTAVDSFDPLTSINSLLERLRRPAATTGFEDAPEAATPVDAPASSAFSIRIPEPEK